MIGKNGQLPWRLPADMARFKALTRGHPVVMGRKTFASMKKPLVDRTNIVVTRTKVEIPGTVVCMSVDDALAVARTQPGGDDVMVIGGGEIYAAALPKCTRIVLTIVHARHEGDAFFPALDGGTWGVDARVDYAADDANAHATSVFTLVRRTTSPSSPPFVWPAT